MFKSLAKSLKIFLKVWRQQLQAPWALFDVFATHVSGRTLQRHGAIRFVKKKGPYKQKEKKLEVGILDQGCRICNLKVRYGMSLLPGGSPQTLAKV